MSSRVSMENLDWVFISNMNMNTDPFSATRPPQHKQSTMSSAQVANTTAARNMMEADVAYAMESQLTTPMANMTVVDDGCCRDPAYPVDHKPPSNVSQGTQNTTSSGATATPINTSAANMGFTSPGFGVVGLTKNVLEQHQHDLELLNPGDIRAWLDGASPAFTRYAVPSKRKIGGDGRHFYGGCGRSKPSHASDGSYIVVSNPNDDAALTHDIMSAGALFNDQSVHPLAYTSPYLEL